MNKVYKAVIFIAALLAGMAAALATSVAHAAPPAERAQAVRIPVAFHRHRRMVQTEAFRLLGPTAPVARIAAQLHTESRWREDARSPVGAVGIGQFMPPTAGDMAKFFASECAPADPLNAAWSIRCAILYDRSLISAVRPFVPVGQAATTGAAGLLQLGVCTQWAFGFSSYNGGGGYLNRDRKLAAANGADPNRWHRAVALWSTRKPAAFRENRDYIVRIMRDTEPAYIAAGMPGTACPDGDY